MVETRNSEINVEQLMAEIREAVARREANAGKSLFSASLELHNFLAAVNEPRAQLTELPPLELQPEFVRSEDDHYELNDLLQYHDHKFIWNAYSAILKREPDEVGYAQFLGNLRSGRYDKIDILASLRFSSEGQGRNVRVDGLKPRPIYRRLYRVPFLGYLIEMLVGILRLPSIVHRRREFEEYALAQQELMATHINLLSKATFQATEPFPEEIADLSQEQRKFAALQHQQVAGLFSEQQAIVQRLEQLKSETNARLAHLSATNGAHAQSHEREIGTANRANLDKLLASFADEFRGKRDEIKQGFRHYLPLLKDAGIKEGILDIGCGRGEWLELLVEEGYQARGVEDNSVLVERLRSLELEVIESDALQHLSGLPSESLNVITAFHFIEHLTFQTLIDYLREITRVLRPGGLVIFETPNPKNLVVGACNFYSDPTHTKPLFPETISFILNNQGFRDVRVEYVNPVTGSPFVDDNRMAKELDSWLYSPRDFAVIGTKA